MVFTGWPWASWSFPLIWAQGVGPRGAATPSGPLVNPNALAPLALRRWFGSLTLCSPDSVPGLYPLFLWLAALGFLAFLVLLFQGPFSALRQLLDLSGHARVFRDATGRLRRSGRMLALTVGLTVLSWTGSQSLSFNAPQGREDQLQITRSRSLVELGFEQGALAALTPLRDVAGLGSNLPMLALAVVILFRATAENWGAGNPTPGMPRRERTSGWATVVWFCGGGYIVYRIIALAQASPDLPLGNCLMIEPAVIPLTMLVCDGILLAWVVTELRDAGFVRQEGVGLDVNAPLSLMPAASLACLAALPARYLATAVFLVFFYLPGAVRTAPGVGSVLRWQSLWGNADVQAAALAFCGLAGAVVWSGGGLTDAAAGYFRLLREQGARLWIVLAVAGAGAGTLAGAAYVVVMSLPVSTWVVAAADGYAHYATLPVGLWLLSALVEVSERSLPSADLALVEPTPGG